MMLGLGAVLPYLIIVCAVVHIAIKMGRLSKPPNKQAKTKPRKSPKTSNKEPPATF